MMGSPNSEPGRNGNETQREITVSSFYMGKFQVTQKEYGEVMGQGNNPSYFKGPDMPVECVSWFDAIEYCNRRSPYNNNARGASRQKTTNVGSFPPNSAGLHDMHGNVWEWCWDWHGTYSFTEQTPSLGTNRVTRGGSWNTGGRDIRSAARNYGAPTYRSSNLGFRVVRP